jgi:alkanesulfonate monooxygenase SsuD/methylene tetrahydromethanopterin reductase-like flavin-dependent oxidoreductase (luciferase family)
MLPILLVPPPRRHILVLIGGAGERRTLPAVARHADIWHTFISDTDVYRPKSQVVGELATVAGRDVSAIERCLDTRPATASQPLDIERSLTGSATCDVTE